jgi:hypothetical protein
MLIFLLNKVFQWAGFFLFVACLVVGVPHSAQSNPIVRPQSVGIPDPIFSSEYDSKSVHFELLETKTLLPNCKKSLSDMNPLPQVLTLYAKYNNASTSIYIVGETDNQKILVLRNGACQGGIPLLSVTQTHHNPPLLSDAPVLTDAEVMGLFDDTLDRHEKAFGSKEVFLKWLDMESEDARSGCKGLADLWCPPTYHTLQPVLQEALKSYRKN